LDEIWQTEAKSHAADDTWSKSKPEVKFQYGEVYKSGTNYGRKTANRNVKNCRFITTCKVHGRVTQLKQQ